MCDKNGNEVKEDYLVDLLRLWVLRAQLAAKAHYEQATDFQWRNTLLTLANATATIGVLFFANAGWIEEFLDGKNDIGGVKLLDYEVALSVVALTVVFTTICQFIVRYSERTYQHRSAGNEYSNFLRKGERYLGLKNPTMNVVHNLNREYNHITKSYPLTSPKIWSNPDRDTLRKEILDLEERLRNKI